MSSPASAAVVKEVYTDDCDSNGHAWKLVPARASKQQAVHGLNYDGSDGNPIFVKVAFLGESGVGKTSLIHRFIEVDDLKKFSHTGTQTTIGVDYKSVWMKSNHPVYNVLTHLQLIDTAGQERFQAIVPQMFSGAQGVFLVFDATCERSFERICNYWRPLVHERNPFCVCMLVATKCDKYMAMNADDPDRWMARLDMQQQAKINGCDGGFHAVSALNGRHVEAMIVQMVDMALAKEQRILGANQHGGRKPEQVVMIGNSINYTRKTCSC